MSAPYDALVIGGGVNGLAAAACLARRGMRVLLLERRQGMGGQARTSEFAPGFRMAPLALDAGWLAAPVAAAAGIAVPECVLPEATISVPTGERAWLSLPPDVARAAEAIRRYSVADAGVWADFCGQLGKHAGFLAALYTQPPPAVDAAGLGELLPLLGLARKLRGLGRKDMIELLRTVPMAVQELLEDRFECEPLHAAVAAGAVAGLRQGPRSGGTVFTLLHQHVGAGAGSVRGRGYWRAGPDALAELVAAAARRNGAELRAGADVVRVLAKDDRVRGVALANGDELSAPVVLSSCDPARTFLELVDPVWLDPEFLLAVRNIKFRGSSAYALYALDGLPEFPGLAPSALTGWVSLSPSLLALERAADAAKYGRVSERLHVELQVPTLRWPSLAPPDKHILVAHAQWAPYQLREGSWDPDRGTALGARITAAIAERAPGFAALISHHEVLTPADLERTYCGTEGATTQGELTLDQILFMRPVPAASRYGTPLPGLYLCGAGSHPGPGIPGAPGWLAARRVLHDRHRGRGENS